MVKRFAATLDNSIKDNPKEIEKAFKVFGKGTKSKENQFVSIYVNFPNPALLRSLNQIFSS